MPFKNLTATLFFTFLFVAVSFGQVDEAYKKSLKKMFKAAGTEQTYHAAVSQITSSFKMQYANVDNEFWDAFEKEFGKTSINQLVEMLAPVYYKYLSQEEMEQIIEFYDSPVGKKLAQSTPLITQESMKIGQEWGMKLGMEIEQKLKEKGY